MAVNANYQSNGVDKSKGHSGSSKVVNMNVTDDQQQTENLKNTSEQLLKAAVQLVQLKANSVSPQDLSPELREALENDPCWQSATGKNPKPVPLQQVGNFFMIVFKYMQDHANADDQIEVCQAVNMVCQNNLLDNLTTEASTTLSSTEAQTSSLESSASKSLLLGLIIGLVGTALAAVGGGLVAGAAGAFSVGVATTIGSVGIGATTGFTSAFVNGDETKISGDSSDMQAQMTVNSSSNANVQNTLKGDMQIQQTEMSDLQSTLSMELQMVQAETKVFTLGTI